MRPGRFLSGARAIRPGLLTDSLDTLADATIYGIALYVVGKPDSAKRVAALTSGIFQGVLELLLVADVIQRFRYGSEPTSLSGSMNVQLKVLIRNPALVVQLLQPQLC